MSHDVDKAVIDIRGLSRRFGRRAALNGVDLSLPAGTVMGLIGPNGAGKTTLIRHVLGLLQAETGSVRVFGRDPSVDPVSVLAQVGYLSEEPDLPAWMRVGELLRYTRAFHPQWDDAYAAQLCREFGLSEGALLRTLSKGQRARAALVAALAYRPALLVLDEPSSGLDPLVRRDILAAIIRTIAEEGRTVLFSSHLLGEVEQVADRVAMIDGGRVLFSAELDTVKESHCRVTVRFPAPLSGPPAGITALTWSGGGREWTAFCAEPAPRMEARAAMVGACVVGQSAVSLDEIFLAHAGRNRATGPEEEGR